MDNNEDKGLSNSRSISEETKFVSSIQEHRAEEKERWLRSKEDVNAVSRTVTTTTSSNSSSSSDDSIRAADSVVVSTLLDNDDIECSICLELLGDRYEITRCGHKFHTHCLTRCFEEGENRCPNCRCPNPRELLPPLPWTYSLSSAPALAQVFYCRYCEQFEECRHEADDLYNYLSGINTAARPSDLTDDLYDNLRDDLYNNLLERNTAARPCACIDYLRVINLLESHMASQSYCTSDFIDELRNDMMRELNHHCITHIHDDMLLCTACKEWMYEYIKCPHCGDFYCPRNGSHDCGMYFGIGIPPETSPEDNYYDSDDERPSRLPTGNQVYILR